MRRSIRLAPLVLLGWAACCPEPPVLDPDLLALERRGSSVYCDYVLPHGYVDFGIDPPLDYDTIDGEEIEQYEWQLPPGSQIIASNDVQSGIGVALGGASGELCVTARMTCGDRSNTACRTITVADPPLLTDVAFPEPEITERQGPVGAVIDGVAYYGLGNNAPPSLPTNWFSFSWETQRFTPLAPNPGGGARGFVAFALDGRVHVIGGRHHVYDPGSDTWTESAAEILGNTSPWAVVFDGHAYFGLGDLLIGRYEPDTESWTLLDPPPFEPVAAFVHQDSVWLVGADTAVVTGTPEDGWTPGSFEGCPLTEVHAGAAVGERAVVVGSGGPGILGVWCELRPGEGWTTHTQPETRCTAPAVPRPGDLALGFDDRAVFTGPGQFVAALLAP